MTSQTTETTNAAAAPGDRIQGRVDAIDKGHIFGWAWHADRPTERLTVEAVHDGRVVARVIADRTRVDLRRNGIGDGSFAFDLQVDNAIDLEQVIIRAVAGTGESQVLRIPSTDERAAEAAVAVPIARVLERLEFLLVAQRQLQLAQRDTSTAMVALTERIDALAGKDGAIQAAVTHVSGAHDEVAERVTSIEVFLSRFDTTLAGFDQRLRVLQKVGSSEVKPLVIMLATLVGFVGGALLLFFLR